MKFLILKPSLVGVFWGIIGGIALILETRLTTKGILQISPYPLILIGALLTIKYTNPENKSLFAKLFTAGFLSFIIMSLILIVYIGTFINSHSGIIFHFWRIGILIGLGIISSFLLSLLAKPTNK